MCVTLLGVHPPGTVRVPEAHTAPTVCLFSTSLHRDGLDLVVTEDDQARQLSLRPADENIADGHVEWEDLELLYQLRPRPLLVCEGDELDDPATAGAGKQHVDQPAVSEGH